MSDIDVDLVYRRLAEIKRLLSEIRELANLGLETFLSDPYVKDAGKYKLLVAIEGAISVCNHIITRVVKEIPSSYSDCFSLLGRHRIIPRELAGRLAEMAKFRNILVHVYWRIDDKRVHDILTSDTSDLETFIQEVKNYVGKKR